MGDNGVTQDLGGAMELAQDGGITTHLEGQGTRETMLGGTAEGQQNTANTTQTNAAQTAPAQNVQQTGAPESYEPFTLPEGSDAGDPRLQAAMGEAQGLFRELGLTQEQAQKVWDLGVKHWMGGAVEAEELFRRQVEQQVDDWNRQVQNDPEIGGARLKENLMYANRAVAALGGRELAEELNKTGMGSNPVLVRAFVKMGRQYFREDRFVQGGGAKPVDNSPAGMAHRIYPNMRRS